MTSAICNQCAGNATAVNKTGRMSAPTGRMTAGNRRALQNKGAPFQNGWGIEAVLELDRKYLEQMSKPKHRREYKRYPLSMEKAYVLNQWRHFIKPKLRRAWLELAVKIETKLKINK